MGVLAKVPLIALLFKVQIIFSNLLVSYWGKVKVIECRLLVEKKGKVISKLWKYSFTKIEW